MNSNRNGSANPVIVQDYWIGEFEKQFRNRFEEIELDGSTFFFSDFFSSSFFFDEFLYFQLVFIDF